MKLRGELIASSRSEDVEELGGLDHPYTGGSSERLSVDLGEIPHRCPSRLLEHRGFHAEALDPVSGDEQVDDRCNGRLG